MGGSTLPDDTDYVLVLAKGEMYTIYKLNLNAFAEYLKCVSIYMFQKRIAQHTVTKAVNHLH